MAETLSDLLKLAPDAGEGTQQDATTLAYLSHLAELSVDDLCSLEPQRLSQASQSLLLSVQALSKRSQRLVVESAASHASLRQTLPAVAQSSHELAQAIPRLDREAEAFSAAFGKAGESSLVARRKQALRLLHNSERLVDVMELPALVASAVKASPAGYSSTLDLYAHVRRLASLYPSSPLVSSVLADADAAIRQMAADLLVALKTPGLKLAAALRTVGWLKRIVPDLISGTPGDDALPALFLVCRLTTLLTTLAALEPLRELADEERLRLAKSAQSWSGGQQTERYLKRFIEVFREHSFGIVSISKSVDASFATPTTSMTSDPLRSLPSVLSTLPLHLVSLLLETLRTYLPTVRDQPSRDSIITQVLYCAGSLGRLGADFGMLLAVIGIEEWSDLVKRHRLLAGRLESVIGDHRGHAPTHTTAALTSR
ncbi:oligomeric golgi complex component [Purpureocillium lavendulum]|uniref:Conserved oligomeric Golgi complex subunit 8 n=1 Tax=Purpureocillium lavendulum TaxID=1247861 RepID=A0AB34G243_9HYPO|nr:oligomeric golgi complex component [Purpureocillium lavendulum]